MRLEKLKELYETCRHLPNYQYRDVEEVDFMNKAMKAFQKLPEKSQDEVFVSFSKVLGVKKSELTVDAIHDIMRYRFMAQTNLYFLCHLLESYNQTTINTHEEICNKFFVQKDPTFPTFESFANQYTDLKERLLLVPRG